LKRSQRIPGCRYFFKSGLSTERTINHQIVQKHDHGIECPTGYHHLTSKCERIDPEISAPMSLNPTHINGKPGAATPRCKTLLKPGIKDSCFYDFCGRESLK